MKSFWIPFSLFLIFLQIPFGPSEPEKTAEEESPVKGWREVKYFAVPPNRYTSIGKGIIKVESLGSRSSLFREVGERKKQTYLVSWRWKISNVVRSAIETRKDRFDAAARLILVFGGGPAIPMLQGTEPIGYKIEYIWASGLPIGKSFDHPDEKNCKVFVLESGDKKAGQWVDEKREIDRDYKNAFGTAPKGLLAVGIQTDTDHSNESVTAYYSEPVLRTKPALPQKQPK